jgi:hypothetical protein
MPSAVFPILRVAIVGGGPGQVPISQNNVPLQRVFQAFYSLASLERKITYNILSQLTIISFKGNTNPRSCGLGV